MKYIKEEETFWKEKLPIKNNEFIFAFPPSTVNFSDGVIVPKPNVPDEKSP